MEKQNKEVKSNKHLPPAIESAEVDQPTYEFEGCESCMEELENDGIQYEYNATWKNGRWVCDECGMPC